MDNFADERDFRILEQDQYTFFVLRRIIGETCELLLTDHSRMIICLTTRPFPVWIWTQDDASDAEMEEIYRILTEHSLLNGEYTFNLKYHLAAFLIKRAAADSKKLSIQTNMFAYDCRNPIPPTQPADGSIHQCNSEDLEELVDFMDLFHKETENDQQNRDSYRMEAQAFINTGTMFFWKNKHNQYVACCKFISSETMASVNLVYTRPEFRRKHYAENLIYQVTKLIIDAGYVPMLYTDADYTASNACYKKIGYVLKGSLCKIG